MLLAGCENLEVYTASLWLCKNHCALACNKERICQKRCSCNLSLAARSLILCMEHISVELLLSLLCLLQLVQALVMPGC